MYRKFAGETLSFQNCNSDIQSELSATVSSSSIDPAIHLTESSH